MAEDKGSPSTKVASIIKTVGNVRGASEARQRVAFQLRKTHPFGIDENDTLYRFEAGRWRSCSESWVRTACHRMMAETIRGHLTPAFVTAIHGMLKADQPLISGKPPSGKINCNGMVVDVVKGTVEEATPNNWPSMTFIPIRWNPAAKTAPRWLHFLETIFPPDSLEYVLELIGSCLVSDVFSQNIIWIAGDGGNGKGTFLKALRELIGPENVAVVSFKALATDKFAAAQVHNKLVVMDGDSTLAQIRDSSIIKQLSAHDVVYAQEKYGRPFPLCSHAKILVAANGRPNSLDTSKGSLDRPLIIPVTNNIRGSASERRQEAILAELSVENEGLIQLLIPRIAVLFKRGRFEPSASILEATKEFRADSSPMNVFFEERVLEQKDAEIAEPLLRQAQREWADQNGFKPLSRDEIASWMGLNKPQVALRRLGRRGEQSQRTYYGICLIDQ